MKAATVKGYGFNTSLVVGETGRPSPGPNDVLVEVHCSSVNPKDWKLNQPLTSVIPNIGSLRPFIIGDDLSGVVVETGSRVKDFNVGDEVYGMDMRLRTVACAEYAVIATKRIARRPANLSFVEAGVAPLAALTALQAFQIAKLGAGMRVLIIGASGGVGTYGVQIAKALGAEVTGVCSYRNVELVESLGADAVIDYTKEDYLSYSDDYDMVFDATSYETPKSCASLLKEDGIFVTTVGQPKGVLSAMRTKILPGKLRAEAVLVESYTEDLDTLTEMFEAGKLKSVIDSEFTLDNIEQAYERSKSGRARGKIAVKIR